MTPSRLLFGLLLILAGGGLTWWALSTIRSYNHLRKRGIPTNAIIRNIVLRDNKGRKYYWDYWLTIEFKDRSKRLHTVSFAAPFSDSFDYLPGGPLPITYDPEVPEIFEETRLIYSRSVHKKLGAGLLLLIVGFAMLLLS